MRTYEEARCWADEGHSLRPNCYACSRVTLRRIFESETWDASGGAQSQNCKHRPAVEPAQLCLGASDLHDDCTDEALVTSTLDLQDERTPTR